MQCGISVIAHLSQRRFLKYELIYYNNILFEYKIICADSDAFAKSVHFFYLKSNLVHDVPVKHNYIELTPLQSGNIIVVIDILLHWDVARLRY